MNVVYSDQDIVFKGKSLFLVGPTPRSKDVLSWRPEALKLLGQMNFSGTVLVPEYQNWDAQFDYLKQLEWEWHGLENCNLIACWIPRDLQTLPGFTTNIEFGSYVRSGRLYYGRPDGSPNNSYLDWLYNKTTNRKPHNSLESLLKEVLQNI